MNFCKDCKHADIPYSINEMHEDETQCKKFCAPEKSYISEVTGREMFVPLNTTSCKYERTIGSCQGGIFFEPR
jgi:alpha-D-ribose 1-methylphosphonate 5-phosphate C-P lyase